MSKDELGNLVFCNCSPELMVHDAIKVHGEFCRDDQIYSAIDYLAQYGIGLCGAYAVPDGRRLCVDGPLLAASSSL